MSPPPGVDLRVLASHVRYVGSVEHKNYPSFAGTPRPRADATLCDPRFKDDAPLTEILAEGIRNGMIGAPWEGDYPRYVWAEIDDEWYEARLVNSGLGHYKGYRLGDDDSLPEGLR